jgi:hypothetical protein
MNAYLYLINSCYSLTPFLYKKYKNSESCSDWAEIFSAGSFINLEKIIFYASLSYFALLKSYYVKCDFHFKYF